MRRITIIFIRKKKTSVPPESCLAVQNCRPVSCSAGHVAVQNCHPVSCSAGHVAAQECRPVSCSAGHVAAQECRPDSCSAGHVAAQEGHPDSSLACLKRSFKLHFLPLKRLREYRLGSLKYPVKSRLASLRTARNKKAIIMFALIIPLVFLVILLFSHLDI